jgi:hypothetical protein
VATPDLKKVKISEIPLNKNNLAICDIYIRMPSQNRYIKFLSEGDPLDNRKKTLLQRHVDPFAYIPNSGATQSADSVAETLSAESEQKLKELYKNIFSPDMSPEEGFKRIESTAEDILNLVAPETKDLKAHLLKNLKYLDLMNDVSAITTIATFVAFSSGFDSKKSYRDLTYACLVMDSSMSEFTDEEVKMYYRDPNSLPPDIAARFKKHPARSHELATDKLKSLNDVTMQLILNHHELFNGKGYPRGVRTESLFALVKVLSLSVDIFEIVKRNQLNGKDIAFLDAVLELREPTVEAHLKRHNKKLVDTVIQGFGIDPKTLDKK